MIRQLSQLHDPSAYAASWSTTGLYSGVCPSIRSLVSHTFCLTIHRQTVVLSERHYTSAGDAWPRVPCQTRDIHSWAWFTNIYDVIRNDFLHLRCFPDIPSNNYIVSTYSQSFWIRAIFIDLLLNRRWTEDATIKQLLRCDYIKLILTLGIHPYEPKSFS